MQKSVSVYVISHQMCIRVDILLNYRTSRRGRGAKWYLASSSRPFEQRTYGRPQLVVSGQSGHSRASEQALPTVTTFTSQLRAVMLVRGLVLCSLPVGLCLSTEMKYLALALCLWYL